MRNTIKRTSVWAAGLAVCSAASTTMAAPTFYVITNKADANTIVGYAKQADGTYDELGEFETGGRGTGDLEIPALKKDPSHPLANGDDPLISAHALASTANKKYVVAVNPGDSTISMLEVQRDGSLRSRNTVRATDRFPISVAIHGRHVVVASVGEDNGKGSIGAFEISNGRLSAVSGSRRDLKARPSTVQFSSDGRFLVVNELVTGKIHSFARHGDSLSPTPVSTVDSPRTSAERFHAIPVGFEVSAKKSHDLVLMSEARFLTPDFKLRPGSGEVVQSPAYTWQTGSLSTYRLDRKTGRLTLVTGDALTGRSVEGGELANCWVALSGDENVLWTANALSSSISSFDIGADGKATLRREHAFKVASEELFFSDIVAGPDGKELFQLVGNRGQVIVFSVGQDYRITPKQILNGLPQLGAYGLVVL